MTQPRSLLLLTALALGTYPLHACKSKRGTVSDTCIQLLNCVATVASTSSGATNDTYGSESECWNDDAAADNCTAECHAVLADYFAQHPTQPSCDDGSVVGTNILFPSGAGFNYQSMVNNAQCDPEVNVSLMQLTLQSDVTPTFTWSGQINGTASGVGFESDYTSNCDVSDSTWTCVQDPVTVTVGDRTIGAFGLHGTFSTDGQASTATLAYDIGEDSGTCTQTQTMSGAQ
ncbi:MAG: hypothetical protein EXR69_13835 [Myxococcales bacterium]|nr:hypothetical protein [Myxococcales bacterium]